MTKPPTNMARNPRIDLIRGWLMLLVIVGHIVLGSVHDNLIRYVIYAFHMPLFIGITGYLISMDKLRQWSFFALLVRYWWRVLLPFLLAFLFFTGTLVVHASEEGRLTSSLLLSYLYTPYYHLWFIPTLVLWVLGLSLFCKLKVPLRWLLLLFLVLSIVWATTPVGDLWPWLTVLLSKKVVYFFAFFLFGVWLNTRSSHKLQRVVANFKVLPAALVMLCGVIYLMEIGQHKELVKGVAWIVLNLGLIVISVVWIAQYRSDGKTSSSQLASVLTTMGRISLPIYLWHVLPLFVLKGLDIQQSQVYVYYSVSVLAIAALVFFLIKMENKSVILNKTVYGN